MHTAFDSEKPEAADAGPHIVSPWLEGSFPDAAMARHRSNCMASTSRQLSVIAFLPSRAHPHLVAIRVRAGRLRTSFLWSWLCMPNPDRRETA